MIWSYYSSTCGGQTVTSPDDASAYCRAVRCWGSAPGTPAATEDLSSEARAAEFWRTTSPPAGFCSGSSVYRWSWSAAKSDAEAVIDRYLPSYFGVSPRYVAGQLGGLRDMSVLRRDPTGKIAALRIAGASASWDATSENAIKAVLRANVSSSSLRATTAFLSVERDSAGVTRINGQGGGFGHGIGMCQYGAKGMGDRGWRFDEILRHYYSSTTLVSVARATYAVPTPMARRLFMPFGNQGGAGCL
jgi:SpoIID/LytB domain protein